VFHRLSIITAYSAIYNRVSLANAVVPVTEVRLARLSLINVFFIFEFSLLNFLLDQFGQMGPNIELEKAQ